MWLLRLLRVFHIATLVLLWPAARAGDNQGGGARRLQPGDLVYQGAFRLPDGADMASWEWSGDALAYCPEGDPSGPDDGYPGSLFGTGHDQEQLISEISIPVPVISKNKDVSELNTAKTLQPFRNIRGKEFEGFEMVRCGLAYLPPAPGEKSGRLHWCWGQHMQESQFGATHGWCELNLADPKPAGPWRIGKFQNYLTNDYLLVIPPDWAAAHTPGMPLAAGRFREGGQAAMGPSIIAYRPAATRDQPAAGSALEALPLLQYSRVDEPPEEQRVMKGYHHSDEWADGVWLTAGRKSAVVFVGTKGQGKCWYGFANGVVWPDEPPYPPIPPAPNDDRGWWSTGFVGQMIFYDPEDLAAVAHGRRKPYEPQPYAVLDIDRHLFNLTSKQQKHHARAATFDAARGLLYVLEFRADGDKCLVHVWKVKPDA